MNADIAGDFMRRWKEGQTEFSLFTSGSTGTPSEIRLRRETMQWSAANTASVLKPVPSDSILCCLPCTRIGGLMMLVRAMEWNIPVEVVEPVSNPFLTRHDTSIVSLTPFQLYHVLSDPVSLNHLKTVRAVIIGGGELSGTLTDRIDKGNFNSTIFYHSYGMTETCSHIALRAINGEQASPFFTPFPDVKITWDNDGCAIIELPFDIAPLHTTDIIKLHTGSYFEIVGRKDFIINTGGVKIQPEEVERAIMEQLKPIHAFIISSEKDEILGNKLILVAEKEFEYGTEDLQFLRSINPYAVPKAIKIVEKLERNEGGKIMRNSDLN